MSLLHVLHLVCQLLDLNVLLCHFKRPLLVLGILNSLNFLVVALGCSLILDVDADFHELVLQVPILVLESLDLSQILFLLDNLLLMLHLQLLLELQLFLVEHPRHALVVVERSRRLGVLAKRPLLLARRLRSTRFLLHFHLLALNGTDLPVKLGENLSHQRHLLVDRLQGLVANQFDNLDWLVLNLLERLGPGPVVRLSVGGHGLTLLALQVGCRLPHASETHVHRLRRARRHRPPFHVGFALHLLPQVLRNGLLRDAAQIRLSQRLDFGGVEAES